MHDVIGLQFFVILLPSIAIGLGLIGLLLFFGCHHWFGNPYSYYTSGWRLVGVFVWGLSALFVAIFIIGLIPFDSKYHVYYKLTGKVESVTNVLENGGDGERTENPVVRISGYSDPIQMDNPRIVMLKGEEVELRCSYEWVYQGMDITNCDLRAIK